MKAAASATLLSLSRKVVDASRLGSGVHFIGAATKANTFTLTSLSQLRRLPRITGTARGLQSCVCAQALGTPPAPWGDRRDYPVVLVSRRGKHRPHKHSRGKARGVRLGRHGAEVLAPKFKEEARQRGYGATRMALRQGSFEPASATSPTDGGDPRHRKRDSHAYEACPAQRPLLGVKRTWRGLVTMSANDPKRTCQTGECASAGRADCLPK